MRVAVFFVSLTLAATAASASSKTDKVIENVRLPTGFKLEVYSDQVPGARSMALGQKGTLFVGTRARGGKVYAISGTPGTAAKPTVRVIGDNLNTPNGVAFHDGALYVAEINRLTRYDDIENSLDNVPQPKVVRDDLPKDGHHGWRYIAFGPDNKLYFPIGAPCNVCNEPKYAMITRMNADGSGQEVFARGIRNTVGFTWHPVTKQLWFTDNGRDWLGDDAPPCELNVATRAGLDFGFPYCHGKDIKDPEFGQLGEADGVPPGEPVRGHDGAEPFGHHGQLFERGIGDRQPGEGEGQLAVVHALDEVGGGAGPALELGGVLHPFGEGVDAVPQIGVHPGGHAEEEGAALRPRRLGQLPRNGADLLEHVPRERQQRGPGVGEGDVVGAAVEKLLPELVLEVLDPLAERRRGHVQLPRGRGEVQFLGDRDEVTQVPKFHELTWFRGRA